MFTFSKPPILSSLYHCLLWASTLISKDIVCPNLKFNPNNKVGIGVYFIHGTLDSPYAGMKLAKGLLEKNQGLSDQISSIHLVAFNNVAAGADINAFCHGLVEKILINRHQKVYLIGHSRGGATAVKTALDFVQQKNIEVIGVTSICGPIKGSDMAMAPATWLLQSVADMQKNSSFTKELNQKLKALDKEALKKRYLFIGASSWDFIVKPDYCYPGEDRSMLVELETTHDHLSVLSSYQLVLLIQNHIKNLLKPAQLEEKTKMNIEDLAAMHNKDSALNSAFDDDDFVIVGPSF